MRRGVLETAISAIILVWAIMFAFYVQSFTTNYDNGKTYELRASFELVDGIDISSSVKMRGVKIGRVEDIELDNETYLAAVVMSIKEGIRIPVNSVAEVFSDGLLGGKYIKFSSGSSSLFMRSNNEVLETKSAETIEQILGRIIYLVADK